MPVTKFSISLQPDTVAAIQARASTSGERSTIINRMLDRYVFVLDAARRTLASKFTPGECGLLVDVFNGTLFSEPFATQYLAHEVRDSYADGYAEKWEVDRAAMLEKMQSLSACENIAIVDAVERWWQAVSEDKSPKHGDLFKI